MLPVYTTDSFILLILCRNSNNAELLGAVEQHPVEVPVMGMENNFLHMPVPYLSFYLSLPFNRTPMDHVAYFTLALTN